MLKDEVRMEGNQLKIFDGHCDVLWKMWENDDVSFSDNNHLHVTWEGLEKGNAKVQCFAIYVPEKIKGESAFQVALEMVAIFNKKILDRYSNMKLVTSKSDIDSLKENEIGAILTLEGCDAIGSDLSRLRKLYGYGVTSVGLTWNYGNAVADGILETRGAGLTEFGKSVVEENNKNSVWTDVSHLSIKGFWDVMESADYIIASHSNCHKICNNPRNLLDDQIKALIQKNAAIGVTFVPQFLTDSQKCTITDILKHVEHYCSLGGLRNIGFGSDFDGISSTVENLHSFKEYHNLVNTLLKYYSETDVKGFLFDNFYNKYPKV
ncbi:hypothetical protein BACCIP111883_00407 [Sutcliffiella rhizosphaerae]|uniref:Membrane dipeptidase n=2 Tax=Sutcliffiella rhizosphaerae TaxID=2880967 RepID=A0ABM8YIC1_9BACI|nr:dipeptidase [Sutcliffiella rhizosphaerae]CAG9619639.1 hypothetical protein BACCIP111883_00407 [Sutcliffiella rhizosphaerae]